jgi:hypothetical protein
MPIDLDDIMSRLPAAVRDKWADRSDSDRVLTNRKGTGTA